METLHSSVVTDWNNFAYRELGPKGGVISRFEIHHHALLTGYDMPVSDDVTAFANNCSSSATVFGLHVNYGGGRFLVKRNVAFATGAFKNQVLAEFFERRGSPFDGFQIHRRRSNIFRQSKSCVRRLNPLRT
jgi:hypothetical protein